VPGLDGRKMSKSYGNTIGLREDPDEVAKKLKTMQTDPARVRRTDPGNPDICPVFDLHKIYSSDETRAWAANGCRTAGIGCLECKKPLIEKVVEEITTIRKRAQEFEENPELVRNIVAEGAEKARDAARATMDDVRHAMNLRVDVNRSHGADIRAVAARHAFVRIDLHALTSRRENTLTRIDLAVDRRTHQTQR